MLILDDAAKTYGTSPLKIQPRRPGSANEYNFWITNALSGLKLRFAAVERFVSGLDFSRPNRKNGQSCKDQNYALAKQEVNAPASETNNGVSSKIRIMKNPEIQNPSLTSPSLPKEISV